MLRWLVVKDWTRADYSHCMIIPFAVLYLLWEARSDLRSTPPRPAPAAVTAVAAAMGLYWLGELAGEFFLMYFSLWLCIVGLCWMHLGRRKLAVIGFPLALLLAAFPLPHFVNNQVTLRLKLLASQLGVEMLHLWGMSAYREGNVIDIGYTQLQVVDACSGLRYLIPLMVLGLLVAYWFKAPLWRRAVLFLSTVPLAIGVNALRIAATGILYERFGAKTAEDFFHGFSGWLIFMLTIAFLWGEMLLLKRYPTPVARWLRREDGHHGIPGDFGSEGLAVGPAIPMRTQSLRVASALAMVLIATSLVISQSVVLREMIPVRMPLDRFQDRVGSWEGVRLGMEPEIIRELDLTQYVLMDYTDESGRVVGFYTAYYESQRKGESIHSPATCMPGGGWVFNESGRVRLPLGKGGLEWISVKRALMEKDAEKQLVYYWFPMRGRILTEAYEIKLFTFWDALTRQRTDGALVRLVTPIYGDERPEQSEARLQSFAREVIPILDRYLPGP